MSCREPGRTGRKPARANYELENIAHVFSHDLQEPLRKIQVFSELLNEGSADKARNYAGKINGLARHMSGLISDIFSYARLSSNEHSFEVVDMNLMMPNVLEAFRTVMTEKRASVICSNLPRIPGVRSQLYQLFSQLFSNSLKFCLVPPVICITHSAVSKKEKKSVGLTLHKPYIKILFQDNGIGFDQKYAEQVFVIFQRLHNSRLYEGTGIGLAICKKVVEIHQGMIHACSAVNMGTTFTIYLPCQKVSRIRNDLPKV